MSALAAASRLRNVSPPYSPLVPAKIYYPRQGGFCHRNDHFRQCDEPESAGESNLSLSGDEFGGYEPLS